MSNGSYVNSYNLINCYVDTSYYYKPWGSDNPVIRTSKFDNENEQVTTIKKDFVIVANEGYKLLNNFSFKLKPQASSFYEENVEWIIIDFSKFQPIDKPLNLNIFTEAEDFQLAGKEISESLYYKMNVNETDVYLFLIGGWNDYKLVFRMYYVNNSSYSNDTYGDDKLVNQKFIADIDDGWGTPIGQISLLDELLFSAESEEVSEPDITNTFFTTYYVDTDILESIKHSGEVPTDLIINTYSYPIKFNEEDITEATIKTGYISTEIIANTFRKNLTSLDIFKFNVPEMSNVIDCYIKIPFNNDIRLDYEDIKGKIIRGYITYEVLTNTTTLFIADEEKILYKNIIFVGVEIPYKPTGELKGFKESETRLAYEEPKLYIKNIRKSEKSNYLKGFIKSPSKILKEELDLLNTLLNEGVFINDENN